MNVLNLLVSGFKVVAFGALLASGLGSAPAHAQQSTFDKIKKDGVFLAGIRVDYPPLGYIDENGETAGFGPDLAREFAKKLGVEVKFIPTTAQNRIPNLTNNLIDAEVSSASITRKREEVVDFSIIYLWDNGAMLVREGESLEPKDYIKGTGKKVSTTQGSIFPKLFADKVGEADFTLFQEYTDAVLALVNKRVDAVLLNEFNAGAFKKQFAGKIVSGKPFVSLPLGITLRQNDSKWRNWVNHTLQDLWADGTYQALFEKHFNEKPTFYMWSPVMLEPM